MIATTPNSPRPTWIDRVRNPVSAVSIRIFIAFLLLVGGSSLASQEALTEGEAKASLLYNFAKFTTWPATAFSNARDPLVIAVIGKNSFGKSLKKFEGKRIKGRSIRVEHFDDPTAYTKSHILFCNVPDSIKFHHLMKELQLEAHNVLTVGDFEQFAEAGGVIGLTFKGNRIALKYNSQAARRAGIYLSENLVNLAERVR